MQTLNVYSTHFFRAFFLLFFGLMMGNVYGGGVKVKLNASSNGDPLYVDSLESDFLIFYDTIFGYAVEGELILDFSLCVEDIHQVNIKITPFENLNLLANNSFSDSLISEKVHLPFNEQKDIVMPISIAYENEAIGYFLEIYLNKDIQGHRYFLRINPNQTARKSELEPNQINKFPILFKYEENTVACFKIENGNDYKFMIIGQDGRVYDSGVFQFGQKEKKLIQIQKNVISNTDQCFIVVLHRLNGKNESDIFWKKFILFK